MMCGGGAGGGGAGRVQLGCDRERPPGAGRVRRAEAAPHGPRALPPPPGRCPRVRQAYDNRAAPPPHEPTRVRGRASALRAGAAQAGRWGRGGRGFERQVLGASVLVWCVPCVWGVSPSYDGVEWGRPGEVPRPPSTQPPLTAPAGRSSSCDWPAVSSFPRSPPPPVSSRAMSRSPT